LLPFFPLPAPSSPGAVGSAPLPEPLAAAAEEEAEEDEEEGVAV